MRHALQLPKFVSMIKDSKIWDRKLSTQNEESISKQNQSQEQVPKLFYIPPFCQILLYGQGWSSTQNSLTSA